MYDSERERYPDPREVQAPDCPWYKPYPGIVRNRLEDGYPVLNEETVRPADVVAGAVYSIGSGHSWLEGVEDKGGESLSYLFDPDKESAGKISYPDVKGLFRLEDGYYVFDSQETFAELNAWQVAGVKTPGEENRITLYDRTWSSVDKEDTGDFFPFNHWGSLFVPDDAAPGGLRQINGSIESQNHEGKASDDEPMNHYFGMSVSTLFLQPLGGIAEDGNPMTFEFSGDDDVWIFIDGVLVGDLGGIHCPVGISIDFSDGSIRYYADMAGDTGDHVGTGLEYARTTIREAFEKAGAGAGTRWTGDTFSAESVHELKFFYLERGNDKSNNTIRFNLEDASGFALPHTGGIGTSWLYMVGATMTLAALLGMCGGRRRCRV